MNEIATLERPQLTAQEVKAGLDLILQVMKNTMEKGKDFGVIPGCKLPSLWKPGSEKILTAFRIGVDPEIENLSTDDEAHFIVKARMFHEVTGIELGKGIGEASSHEEKYKWRKAVCDQEFNETPEDRKRTVWKKSFDKAPYQVKQVRTNKADVSNTVLKMAKKRAQVDGTLTTTAASAVFTQDLEDLEAEVRDAIIEGEAQQEARKPIADPKPKDEKKSAPKEESQTEGQVEEAFAFEFIPVSSGLKNKRYYVKDPEGVFFATFDKAQGELICKAREDKVAICGKAVKKGDYVNIVEVKLR